MAVPTALVAIDGDNVDRTLFGELKSQLAPGPLMQVVQELLPDHTVWGLGFYTVPMQDQAALAQERYFSQAEAAGIRICRWRRGTFRGRTVGYPDSWVMDRVRSEHQQFDTLVLVTADRDYLPLLEDCRDWGKQVMVITPQPVAWPSTTPITVHEIDWLEAQHPDLLVKLDRRPSWVLLGSDHRR